MSGWRVYESNRTYYMRVWTDVLHVFNNWSATDVEEWLQSNGWLEDMDNPDDWLYHRSPLYWIRYLLIPDQLKSRLSHEGQSALADQILVVFHDDIPFEFPPDTDWAPYRANVQRLLDANGQRNPSAE